MQTATATAMATATTAARTTGRPSRRAIGFGQPSLWGQGPIEFSEVEPESVQPLDEHSFVLHRPAWLHGADTAFDEVAAATHWRQVRRPMYDRIVDVPRLIATADIESLGTTSALARIAGEVADLFGAALEHIGLNYYRNGNDSVAWHRDRIGDARDWSLVALVSLGGPRELQLRRYRRPGSGGGERSRRTFTLHSGDLFVMGGSCQRDWEHTVSKVAVAAPRISIALRTKQFPQGPLFQHRGVTP